MSGPQVGQLKWPSIGDVISPAMAMRLAIDTGHKGAGFVSPNPLVGCTIVDRDHRLLAVGYHHRVGAAHAEIDALKKLSRPEDLMGCHVYVTLEPCAHQGRTPSCAKTLAPLNPESLTYAVEDPNPLVAGKGAEILRLAGVKTQRFEDRIDVSAVERTELTEQAEELAEIFLTGFRLKRPFVAVKVATSFDGQMAMRSGESKWITGEIAREHVQLLRARYDAVLIGHGTYAADNPSLNVRHPKYPDFKNRVVLLDPHGKSSASIEASKLAQVRPASHLFIVTSDQIKKPNGAGYQHIALPVNANGDFDIDQLLAALKDKGLTSILVEGGAHTFGSFFESGRVDRLHAYVAPILLGGRHGLGWSSHFGGQSMVERIQFNQVTHQNLGPDLYWTARL